MTFYRDEDFSHGRGLVERGRPSKHSSALIWSWWWNTLTSEWNPRHNWCDLSVILLWSRSCPNLNPAMYPWPWHWTLTIGRENWWSPNDHIYWAPSRRSNCSTKVNKWSTDMRRSWVLGSHVTKSLKKNPGKKCYRSHCQMLGKVEYGLPAKIWRLVGCTEMLSW